MAEFTRAIVARARQYVGDRRRSRRLSVRLPFSLALVSASKSLNGTRRISSMDGHTLDVSENSIALIVPKITLDEHHLVGENRNFNLKLELPDGPLEMQAAPVRSAYRTASARRVRRPRGRERRCGVWCQARPWRAARKPCRSPC